MGKLPESSKRKARSGPSGRRSRKSRLRDEYRRLEAFDREYLVDGRTRLAGIDEVGRGALAGPVVAAAVILPRGSELVGVTDSKTIDEDDRGVLYDEILAKASAVGIGVRHADRIDSENILNATLVAMGEALRGLEIDCHIVLVDGRDRIEFSRPVVSVVNGDARSLSIAAASIVAKVTRDKWMRALHDRHPNYNFLRNKGYGTKEHIEAIDQHGMIAEHRRSFLGKVVAKAPMLF